MADGDHHAPVTMTAGKSRKLTMSAFLSADQEDFRPGNVYAPNTVTRTVHVIAVAPSVRARAAISLTNPSFWPRS